MTFFFAAAYGSDTRVDGCGEINLEPFKLKDMLHVPCLWNNLIYVRKLIKDNICAVIFFDSHCAFEDLVMGKTIGVA